MLIASGEAAGEKTAHVCSQPQQEVDYVSVTLAQPGSLEVKLSWPGGGELVLFVDDAQGKPLAEATVARKGQSVSLPGLAAGVYYVKVKRWDTDFEPTKAMEYTVSAKLTP